MGMAFRKRKRREGTGEKNQMKAAIYCRVSTEGQEQDGTSLQTQLEACRKYCQARRYEVGH